MTRALAAAFLLAAIALPAAAQQDLTTDPTRVQDGSYGVEPQHTQVEFAVSHMGFTSYYGRFADASGHLELSAAVPERSRLRVRLPVASVSTTSAALNDMLRGEGWFDAAKYPDIVFVSTRVVRTGAATADVEGELTMHGVTRPLTLQARFQGAGINPLDQRYTVGFAVSGRVRRSDFGITRYVPLVGDDVELTISGAFEREGL